MATGFFSALVLLAGLSAGRAGETEAPSIAVILAPHQRAVLSTEVPSRVVEVRKEMGQSFAEGEPLVLLDSTIYAASRDKAEAQVKSAAAQLQSKQNLLVDGGASVAEVETARMNLAVARSNLVLARKEFSACTIEAPFAGRVVRVLINRHEVVQPGQELIEVVDDSILRAQFLVPSNRLRELAVGQAVQVSIYETQKTVQGTISHVGGVVDPASSTVKVFAAVENAAGELRGGMRGRLRLGATRP